MRNKLMYNLEAKMVKINADEDFLCIVFSKFGK